MFIRFKDKANLSAFLNSISPQLNFISNISPQLITFMVSAFWHGFYPNYYIFFFTCFIVEQICSLIGDKTYYFEILDSYERSDSLVKKALYFLIGIFHLNILNFCGLFFQMLTFDKLWIITKNTNGLYWIGIVIVYLYAMYVPRSKEKIGRKNPEEKNVSSKVESISEPLDKANNKKAI